MNWKLNLFENPAIQLGLIVLSLGVAISIILMFITGVVIPVLIRIIKDIQMKRDIDRRMSKDLSEEKENNI